MITVQSKDGMHFVTYQLALMLTYILLKNGGLSKHQMAWYSTDGHRINFILQVLTYLDMLNFKETKTEAIHT